VRQSRVTLARGITTSDSFAFRIARVVVVVVAAAVVVAHHRRRRNFRRRSRIAPRRARAIARRIARTLALHASMLCASSRIARASSSSSSNRRALLSRHSRARDRPWSPRSRLATARARQTWTSTKRAR
jgi:hypothetical protein